MLELHNKENRLYLADFLYSNYLETATFIMEVMILAKLGIFGFEALWSPYFFTIILLVTIAYFLVLVKFRRIFFKTSEPLTHKHGVLFVTSMALLYIIKGSPLDLMAHLMFYIHMIQMAILLLVIPPLLILAIPQWLWRNFLNYRVFRKIFLLLTKPLIALIFFNGLFSFYHIPLIFDHAMENSWLHAGYSILLFMAAIVMWWPLINELPETQTLNGIKKIGYIFADGMLLTPACALIIFANTPMYATYSDPNAWGAAMKLCVGTSTMAHLKISGPELFSSVSPLQDQQLGGVLMKVIQEIIYGIVLGFVFFDWYRKDQAESEREMKQHLNPTLAE